MSTIRIKCFTVIDKQYRVRYNKNATQMNNSLHKCVFLLLVKVHTLFRMLMYENDLCRSNQRCIFQCAALAAHFLFFIGGTVMVKHKKAKEPYLTPELEIVELSVEEVAEYAEKIQSAEKMSEKENLQKFQIPKRPQQHSD